jgi:hypothetical protein
MKDLWCGTAYVIEQFHTIVAERINRADKYLKTGSFSGMRIAAVKT